MDQIKTAQVTCPYTLLPKQGIFKSMGVDIDGDNITVKIFVEKLSNNNVAGTDEILESFPISNPHPFLALMFNQDAINSLIDFMTSKL